MKKIVFIASIIVFLFASRNISANNEILAYFDYAVFNTVDNEPYIETYLSVVGESVIFKKNTNGKFQASIEIIILFKQSGQIVDFRKYNLLSPEITDTLAAKPTFIDQQRISLPNGIYNFEFKISDNNKSEKKQVFNDIIVISLPKDEISFSDIQFIEKYSASSKINKFTKSGYDLVPFVSNFFPNTVDKLIFYCELYYVNKVFAENEKYLCRYFIESSRTHVVLSEFNRFQKKNAKITDAIIGEFIIDDLATGNYNLVLQIRNSKNEIILEKKSFFQRSNPGVNLNLNDINSISIDKSFVKEMNDIELIKENIESLHPISSAKEQLFAKNVVAKDELTYMQKYFFEFWKKRNSLAPEQEWKIYKEVVDIVNKSYSTQIKKGYETDRGRVYLKYGTPNSIETYYQEPDAYPYEIWHYYQIDVQTNCFFIFYNPYIVGKEFWLLHSNVIGEFSNPDYKGSLTNNISTPNINILDKQ